MAKVLAGMTMSLDGFVNDREGSVALLYPDMAAMRESESLQELIQATGAAAMGRRSYDMAGGDLTGYKFQLPIFVVTHRAMERAPRGVNEHLTVTFIPDGVECAIAHAKTAAGEKYVTVIGGADTIQQCLNAGLVDELQIDIRPVLLGDGLRLFEHLDVTGITLERTAVAETPELRFRVIK